MSLVYAFEITPEDIEAVLRQNSLLVANTQGRTFAEMAEELIVEIETDRISAAALRAGTDLEAQTDDAYAEIRAILVEEGILKR